MRKKIRVLLADDTLIAREGWRRIIETTDYIEVVGDAETPSNAVEKAASLSPDIVLMDLLWFSDETAGWQAIREIKQKYGTKIRIIAVTAYERLVADARRAGADAVLQKTFTRDQLLSEIQAQAHRINDPGIRPIPLNAKENIKEDLTNRELEVLHLLEEGHSDKEVAQLLGIAVTTTKNHVKNILGKLSAKNRTQAVSIAREMGILR